MSLAALIVAIVGVVLAASSLTWNVVLFLLQGARPKLQPIIGIRAADGLVVGPASAGMAATIQSTAQQFEGSLVIGVEVVNVGRAPLHIHKWTVSVEPFGASLIPLGQINLGDAEPPCDIAPGATQSFVTHLDGVRAIAMASEATDPRPQRVICTVQIGVRTYKTKPIVKELLNFHQ